VILRLPQRSFQIGQKFYALLLSDTHIGAHDCDKALLVDDLEWAKKHDADVLVDGDLCDLILPKDHKRFMPSVLDKEITASDSVCNATIDLCTRLLRPYAANIRMIGTGNHESAMQKYHSLDVTRLIIRELNRETGADIKHGGYTGAVVWTFRRGGGGGTSFSIYYHHGFGGSAPVTKGMIDFNRLSTYARGADVIWCGHKHWRWASQVVERHIPQRGTQFVDKPVWHIMTGSYVGGPPDQFDRSGSYQSRWATEKGFAPQGKGGAKLVLTAGMDANGRGCIKCEVVM
jgi:hypothetical protein